MRRWMLALMIAMMLLGLMACGSAPESDIPEEAYDLAYDMTDYDHFAEIFDAKPMDEWAALGEYTILLQGLHTPVLVDMNGMDVLAVSAYGYTEHVQIGLYQGETPMEIQSAGNAILVNETRDYDGSTWILTEAGCHEFHPEGDISTQIFADDDGAMQYHRYWGEYVTSFEQWDTAPLELCTSRDQFLYETGHAELRNGEVVLTSEKTVTVSDEYDLDAMFADAKASGMFEEYETADALLAANQAGANK